MAVKRGNVIGGSSADEVVVNVFPLTGGQLRQVGYPQDGGRILISQKIRGYGDVEIVLNSGELDHACDLIGHGPALHDFQIPFAGSKDGAVARNEIDIVAVDGKRAHVCPRQFRNGEHFFQRDPRAVFGADEDVEFAGHGAERIEAAGGFIVHHVMGANADVFKSLGHKKAAVLFFKDKNPVVVRVVSQKDGTVSGDGMAPVDLIGEHRPFGQGQIGGGTGQDLVVVTVHEKIVRSDFGDLGRHA